MISIFSLLLIISLSILITRIATIALLHTGLSRESARFQARSAFTGVGFTTSESEKVVNHPVRRRILLLLMLLGNAGVATAMSSLIVTFINPDKGSDIWVKMALLLFGLLLLWTLAQSKWIDRHIYRIVNKALKKYTTLQIRDYASLLQLTEGYRVTEFQVRNLDWLANKKLKESQLRQEGVIVLAINREDGVFLGAPHGDTEIHPKDTLILYGRTEDLNRLDKRHKGTSGDKDHNQAVDKQKKVISEEKREDEEVWQEGGKASGNS